MPKLSKRTTEIGNFILNEIVPPIIRDNRLLMLPLFRLFFGARARHFMEFREKAYAMTEREYQQAYQQVADLNVNKESDLNHRCFEHIPLEVRGSSILEVGSGRGSLAEVLVNKGRYVASDICYSSEIAAIAGLEFVTANAEQLPFASASFDTVICTHVLEHVKRIDIALAELRRIARRRLILVVPRERPYAFGFNYHLTFFPYQFSVQQVLGRDRGDNPISIRRFGGDWLYIEDLTG